MGADLSETASGTRQIFSIRCVSLSAGGGFIRNRQDGLRQCIKTSIKSALKWGAWAREEVNQAESLFAIVKMAYANAKEFQSKVQIFEPNAQGC